MTEKQLRAEIVNQAKSWVGRKESDGSHRKIIDAQGAHTFDVMDGEDSGSVEEVFWATYNTTTEAEVTALQARFQRG